MGKKSAPPPAPDYTGAAKETAAGNAAAIEAQTRANRVNQVTPWGQQRWSQNPAGQWTQSTTLTPGLQSTLDNELKSQNQRSQLASGMMGRVGEATSQPFDWGNLTDFGQIPGATNTQAPGAVNPNLIGSGPRTQAGPAVQAGNLSTGPQTQAGNLQAGPRLDGGEDIRAQMIRAGGDMGRQRIEDAALDRLRPEEDRARAQQEAKLANMGLQRGSAAWNRESQRLSDEQSRRQFDALQYGGQEQSRQFDMMARASGQNFDQMARADDQNFGQRRASLADNFSRQAAAGGQNFDQQARANQDNFGRAATANNQNFGQRLASSGQRFDQTARSNTDNFARNAQTAAQNFGQTSASRAQDFSQRLGANQQNYGQRMTSAQAQTQQRQQQIQEQMLRRQMPLNEFNALMSGQQVQSPQFSSFFNQGNAGGANLLGAAGMQNQAATDRFSAGQAGKNSSMQGLGQIAGLAGMFSDDRLKSDIVRIGDHPRGIGIYEYTMFGQRDRGVLASEVTEVAPHLITKHPSGYLMVNYQGL